MLGDTRALLETLSDGALEREWLGDAAAESVVETTAEPVAEGEGGGLCEDPIEAVCACDVEGTALADSRALADAVTELESWALVDGSRVGDGRAVDSAVATADALTDAPTLELATGDFEGDGRLERETLRRALAEAAPLFEEDALKRALRDADGLADEDCDRGGDDDADGDAVGACDEMALAEAPELGDAAPLAEAELDACPDMDAKFEGDGGCVCGAESLGSGDVVAVALDEEDTDSVTRGVADGVADAGALLRGDAETAALGEAGRDAICESVDKDVATDDFEGSGLVETTAVSTDESVLNALDFADADAPPLPDEDADAFADADSADMVCFGEMLAEIDSTLLPLTEDLIEGDAEVERVDRAE